MKQHSIVLSFLTLPLFLVSCKKSDHGGASIPPIKVGKFYDITLPSKAVGPHQNSFRVVALTNSSWIQVETYDDPNSVFAAEMILAFASKDSASSNDEFELKKKRTIEEIKKMTKLTWINLQVAASIAETDPKKLGILKDM
ncbi:MAG: hypothetical protein V4819_24145 [Verrucomicrobiota bacterium]